MHNTRKDIKELLLLLLVWMLAVYGVNVVLARPLTPEKLHHLNISSGLFGLFNFIPFYIYLRWIIPPFLQSTNWWKLLLSILPVLLGSIAVKYFIADHFFREEILYMGYRYEEREKVLLYLSPGNYFLNSLWSGAIIILAAFSYRFFILWLEEDKRRAVLQQQQLQAESGFLKMQLNSHFLINSLNSIYSLALMNSPEVVRAHKTLTDLLAYMVEQPSDIAYRAPIAEEIRYLQDFVTLQRIRTGYNEGIAFSWNGMLTGKEIAPLLLVPFVENAFKHGITNRPEKPVTIALRSNEQQLQFSVHNFVAGTVHDKTGGIGLENVRKRLQLIYPGQHQLEITAAGEEYFTNLTINW